MTEQELKEKIVGGIIPIIEPSDELIIIETMGEKPSARKVAERIADALIAAGLTFDGEWKRRAEVAEKELLVYKEVAGAMLCEIDCSNEGYCPEFYKDPECKNCTKKKIYGNFAATSPCLLDKYIQQAERELAEENNAKN